MSALLLYPFGTFLARGRGARDPNLLDRAVIGVTAPIQRAIGWAVDGVSEGWRGYVALRGVRADNARLEEEVRGLRAQVHALAEAERENARLKGLLQYADEASGQEVPARVIAVNPVSHPYSLRIDRGEHHGVRAGCAVVTADGVVGRVIRATGGYADVMTVKDPSSRMAVRVQRSRARATAAGAGGDRNLSLENLLRTEEVADGDLIVTSGTDGVFPPGLPVGRAAGVARKAIGMFQSAEVVPAVDMTRVEEVLVLPPVEVGAPATVQVPAERGAAP